MINFFRDRFRWLASIDLFLLLTALVAAAGLWIFVFIVRAVNAESTTQFDQHIIGWLQSSANPLDPAGPLWLREVGRDVTALGGTTLLLLITTSVAGFLAMTRKRHECLFLVGATVGGVLISTVLKDYFDRARPTLITHGSYVLTSSFPSGHSMLSAVVYLTLGSILARLVKSWRLKIYFISIAVFLTLIVGVSRVYMGVHWPTDVLAGWSAGLTWALICSLTARMLQKQGTLQKADDAMPT